MEKKVCSRALSNTVVKRTSIANEMKEESFIIGMALALKIPLKLKRKSKQPNKLQTIFVEEIMIPELQQKVTEIFNSWKASKTIEAICEQKQKIEQRDYVKTRQNIMINVLIETMMEMGFKFTKRSNRKSVKNTEKMKIKTCNGMKEESMRELGVEINKYIIERMPIPLKRSKGDCMKVFDSIDLPLSQFPLVNIQNEQSPVVDIDSLTQMLNHRRKQTSMSVITHYVEQGTAQQSFSSNETGSL